MVASLFVTLHVPPVVPSVYVAGVPRQTLPGPVTVPAEAVRFTVTVVDAVAVPQLPPLTV
jgi:hypothetical protein